MDPTTLTEYAPDRRRFLTRAVQAGVLLSAAGPIAACGSSSSSSSGSGASVSGSADLGELRYQLSWIKNVEFAGSYIADSKGYYTKQGFSKVTLIGGGPSATPGETMVVTKKATVATSSTDATAAAISKGAPLKIIAAQYQESPFAIMSMANSPIKTPQDMYGKSIGVQADNENVWNAFLAANKLDAAKITKVPVQFDPLPLTQGKADGWMSFITNEPIDLEEKGFKVHTFLLGDYNYPMVSNVYLARTDSLTSERKQLKAFLKAEIMGWKDSLADPALGAQLTTSTYGKSLGLSTAEQTLESKAQNKLIQSASTKKTGIFLVTPELMAGAVDTLGIGGTKVTRSQLFDMSLLKEVYAEDPSLI